MTSKEFASAISRLTVQPGPGGFVIGRPIYASAGGAFNRTGAGGWIWFCKRARIHREATELDESAARAQFIAWLTTASERQIGRFIEAADRYRPALITAGKKVADLHRRELAAYREAAPENEIGSVMKGAEGRVAWRLAESLAGHMATEDEMRALAKMGKPDEPDAIDRVMIKGISGKKRAKQIWDILVAEGKNSDEIESDGDEVWIPGDDGCRKRSIGRKSIDTVVSRLKKDLARKLNGAKFRQIGGV
jgi:hypothetical protein